LEVSSSFRYTLILADQFVDLIMLALLGFILGSAILYDFQRTMPELGLDNDTFVTVYQGASVAYSSLCMGFATTNCLFVCLFVYLFVCLFICLFVCLFV